MSTVASKGFVLACTFAVLIVTVVLHFAPRGPTTGADYALGGTGRAGSAGSVGPGGSAGPFIIEGSATEPISPGVRAPLDVRLTNPHDFPMAVADLRVSVLKVSAPHADHAHPCAVGDFTVDQATSSPKISVGANSTETLTSLGFARATLPQVGMLDLTANQDGCKGASLTLAYAASGTAQK